MLIILISYKKLVLKENKFWSLLINYHPTISKISDLPKAHKPEIPFRPIISGMGFTKFLAKSRSSILSTISYAPINNSGSLFNKIVIHHHHHVALSAYISLTLSRHPSLSFIASGRSSGLHPVLAQSCYM